MGVEPKYNQSIKKLLEGNIDHECIWTIAGFVSYVMCCSPTGMRLGAENFASFVDASARVMDAHGVFPPAPPELGRKSYTELLDSGDVIPRVDPKFPQAIGIEGIHSYVAAFGNFPWDILVNDHEDCPFFTGDYPIAIEETNHPWVLNKIVPLTPNIAVRIRPDIHRNLDRADFTFSDFSSKTMRLRRKEVVDINRLIVRCSESMVFFRDQNPWIQEFVQKNSGYRIEVRPQRVTIDGGYQVFPNQRIVSTKLPR
jgi:hypothetical protein